MKRTILQEKVCHLCSVHPEDVKHVLWGCSKVRQVWQRCFGWLVNTQDEEGSFSDLVQLAQTKPRLFPLFAVTTWTIWHHRNKSHLQAATLPLDRLVDFARKYLQIYADRNVNQMPPMRSVASTVCWSPPCGNQVKINFDGALFGESDYAGIGVVIRNSEGVVMAAMSEKIVKPQATKLAEILAAQCAVLFSRESGCYNPVFEGDSSTIIKSLQDRIVSHAQGRHILKDILSHLNSFQSCSLSHIGK